MITGSYMRGLHGCMRLNCKVVLYKTTWNVKLCSAGHCVPVRGHHQLLWTTSFFMIVQAMHTPPYRFHVCTPQAGAHHKKETFSSHTPATSVKPGIRATQEVCLLAHYIHAWCIVPIPYLSEHA